MTEHTPSPWEISEVRTTDDTFMIIGGDGQQFGLVADVTTEADATYIVKACNAFPDLVKALEKIGETRWKDDLDSLDDIIKIATDALAAVKGAPDHG